MTTFIIVIAITALALFLAMKTGKVKDANNNNIPDVIEDKVEEVKVAVEKVKAVAEKATKVAKTIVTEKPAVKKTTAKKVTKK